MVVNRDRDTGISIIGAVPQGTQICLLYNTKSDYFKTIAQFFIAGLNNNELCVVIHAKDSGLEKSTIAVIPELAALIPYLKKGQLELYNNTISTLEDGPHDYTKSIASLISKVNEAVDKGYKGLRVAGEVAGRGREVWLESIQSRIEAVKHLNGAPILGLSAYPLNRLGVSEIITLANIVPYVFIRYKGKLSRIEDFEDRLRWDTFSIGRTGRFSIMQRLMKIGHEKQVYLDNAAFILLATNATGNVIHINNKGCEVIKYTKNEIIGKNWFDNFVPPRMKEEVYSNLRKLLSGEKKEVAYYESLILTKSGEERLIAWYTTIIRDYHGNVKSVYSTGMDITERKQEEERYRILLRPNPDDRLTPLQEKYISAGFHEFNEKEIIELFFSLNLPLDVATRLAEVCVENFHSLREFLAAPVLQLQNLGIPRSCIFSLKLIHELPVRILKEELINQPVYSSSNDIFNFLYYSMRDLKTEVFKVIYLNVRNQIIEIIDLVEGTSKKIILNAQEVVESAYKHDAHSLIFVHNHPSGDPAPSPADNKFTRDLVFVGNILQIEILDHIIIGDNTYYSFAFKGLIKEYQLDFLNLKLTGTVEAKNRLSKSKVQISKEGISRIKEQLSMFDDLRGGEGAF